MNNSKIKSREFVFIAIVIILMVIITWGYSIKTTNDKIEFVFYLNDKFVDIHEKYTSKALEYYDLAGEDYIQNDFKGVVSNCEKAREYFSEEGQKFREVKAEVILSNPSYLNELYINLLKEKIIISNSLYETCEYFESASKYYEIYYDINTPSDDSSYYMGGQEMDRMNEKIQIHDDAVERHNDILSYITRELIVMIK